jgi:hypothetical protein
MTVLNHTHFVKTRAALAQRRATALFVDRRGRALQTAANDDEEMTASNAGEPTGTPIVYGIVYRDTKGNVSERTVTLRWIEFRQDHLLLHCTCHLRQMQRSFRADRIVEVYDITTGEVFDDPITFFQTHPILAPEHPEDISIKTCKYELTILTTVGAADGLFDPDEQDQVLIHVYDRCIDLPLSEEKLRRKLALFAPDEVVFWGALKQMSQFRKGDPRLLLRTLRRLVDADGRLAPEEVAFVSEIQGSLAPLVN